MAQGFDFVLVFCLCQGQAYQYYTSNEYNHIQTQQLDDDLPKDAVEEVAADAEEQKNLIQVTVVRVDIIIWPGICRKCLITSAQQLKKLLRKRWKNLLRKTLDWLEDSSELCLITLLGFRLI